jgi:hypothetical protein
MNRKKIVVKESKMYIYTKIAHAVFSADENPQICTGYTQNVEKIAWAVENHLQTLVFSLSPIIADLIVWQTQEQVS